MAKAQKTERTRELFGQVCHAWRLTHKGASMTAWLWFNDAGVPTVYYPRYSKLGAMVLYNRDNERNQLANAMILTGDLKRNPFAWVGV